MSSIKTQIADTVENPAPAPAESALPALASIKTRVEQIHHSALNALYACNYYKEIANSTLGYSRHFDFAIGLGAALSGASGLGILGNPNFAWLCGIITTASIILTAAKSSYDWPGRIKQSTEIAEKYGTLFSKYNILVQNLNFERALSPTSEATFAKLRDEEAGFTLPPWPDLAASKQKEIQDDIKKRIDYKKWWMP